MPKPKAQSFVLSQIVYMGLADFYLDVRDLRVVSRTEENPYIYIYVYI